MLVAKTKVIEKDLVSVVVEYIFNEETRELLVLQHNFVRVKDETGQLGQDHVIHQTQPHALLENVDGCKLLEVMGNEQKKGTLLDIEWVKEYPTRGIEKNGGKD